MRDYDIQRPEVEYPFFLNTGMATSYIDENKTFIPIGNWVIIRNTAIGHGGSPIEIKAVRAVPSSTNFMDIDKGQLMTPESMIFGNNCLGKSLTSQDEDCDLEILTGQNGYGSAGTLEIDYSIDGGATQTMSTTLPDIAQAEVTVGVNNPDPNNSNMVDIWKTGDAIQPIYVNTSKVSAGFSIDNSNTNYTGTYVLIEYDGEYKPIIPNCLAWVNAVDGYMYNHYYFCAYEFDFSKKNVGDVVKTKLIMGNHKETILEVNFTITN